LAVTKEMSLENGTGANQANNIYSTSATLSASASADLDLAGSLLNPLGAAVVFTKVKAILVIADAANTNDVVVGGASATQFVAPFGAATDKINVKPGGMFLLTAPNAAGLAVGAGTADLLKFANGGGTTSVTYTLVIIGVS
jgi:hypothetical protein